MTGAGHEDVRRLDVAMQHSHGMGVAQRLAQPLGNPTANADREELEPDVRQCLQVERFCVDQVVEEFSNLDKVKNCAFLSLGLACFLTPSKELCEV